MRRRRPIAVPLAGRISTSLHGPGETGLCADVAPELAAMVRSTATEHRCCVSQVIRDALCAYLDAEVREYEERASERRASGAGGYITRAGRPAARRVA